MESPDLTEGIWQLVEHQYDVLQTRRPEPPVSLEDALKYRQLLTQLYYRKWNREENPKEPAGYLVHFSPRTGETLGSLIEFGFSGDQTLLAYAQTVWGQDTGVPLYVDRASTVIDFFVDHCQLENGYFHGIYDPIHDRFTQWFTGILMPFQYATSDEELRRYVGRQIADSLTPVARELRTVEGNYLRTMCEAIYPVLPTYERSSTGHDSWLTAGVRFGEFLLRTQADDGSWYRAYSPAGEGLTSPAAWFGHSYLEQKTGSIFQIPILTTLGRLTGDGRYLEAVRKAATFIIETFVEPVAYAGGLKDTTHIKSVKTDSVGVMFLMRSLWKAFEVTGEPAYLDGAVIGRIAMLHELSNIQESCLTRSDSDVREVSGEFEELVVDVAAGGDHVADCPPGRLEAGAFQKRPFREWHVPEEDPRAEYFGGARPPRTTTATSHPVSSLRA